MCTMSKKTDNDSIRLDLEMQLGEATKKFHYHLNWYKKYKRDTANIQKKLWLLAKEQGKKPSVMV